jgi:hypothetical protein
MCPESFLALDLEVFQQNLAAVVDSARSLDEIQAWLNSQQSIESVRLGDYLLKSNPPQRDLIVQFKAVDGSIVNKVATIFDLGNQQFRFNKLRDE